MKDLSNKADINQSQKGETLVDTHISSYRTKSSKNPSNGNKNSNHAKSTTYNLANLTEGLEPNKNTNSFWFQVRSKMLSEIQQTNDEKNQKGSSDEPSSPNSESEDDPQTNANNQNKSTTAPLPVSSKSGALQQSQKPTQTQSTPQQTTPYHLEIPKTRRKRSQTAITENSKKMSSQPIKQENETKNIRKANQNPVTIVVNDEEFEKPLLPLEEAIWKLFNQAKGESEIFRISVNFFFQNELTVTIYHLGFYFVVGLVPISMYKILPELRETKLLDKMIVSNPKDEKKISNQISQILGNRTDVFWQVGHIEVKIFSEKKKIFFFRFPIYVFSIMFSN